MFVNPVMLRGVKQSPELRYGSDPSLGFFLTTLYLNKPTNSVSSHITYDTIYLHCFEQFSTWCTAFRTVARAGKGSIHYYCGEALDFCDILNQKANSDSTVFGAGAADNGVRNPNIIVGKGQLVPEQLQASTPHSFEVIDTSNLSDSSGLPYLMSSVRVLLYWRHTRTGKFPLCFT